MKKFIVTLAMACMMAGSCFAQSEIAFGTKFSTSFRQALSDAYEANQDTEKFVVDGMTVVPSKAGNLYVKLGGSAGYVSKALTMSFVAAEAGDGVLSVKVNLAKPTKEGTSKKVVVRLAGKAVDAKTMVNRDMEDRRSGTFNIKVPGVKKGDVISIVATDSNNHQIGDITWSKAE